jgi:uncharacterized membrane protein
MSNLFVVAFDNEMGATNCLSELAKLQQQELIKLEDAATLIRRPDGKVRIKQAQSLVGTGALGGAFWGMLIGLLFWAPFLGMAVGAALGAGAGKASDYGIDDHFIKEVGEAVKPGTSALFVLVRESQPDKVIERLKGFNGEIIHTSLSSEQEMQLREAFSAA